ncbi:MAG TPA: iron chelate uptake ABC transporter family permease subunit [Pirellulales bacterium]|nr:iron chelate uptake ABC transporter family permease subunit [Pirellulales bacterium]
MNWPSSWWPNYNTIVVLAGTSVLGAGAGLAGCFAVLRRRALLGDALAHAGLPGICLGFLVWQERSLPVMLCGALVTGLLGVLVVSLLRRYTRIKEDAAIGIVLSVFFAAGTSLSRFIQTGTTGGSRAGLDSYTLGAAAGMRAQDVYLIAGVSAACLLLIVACYKEFKVVAFDPGFARVQGWPAVALDLLLTALVAVMVVIGLPAVGVVLMAALLIIPAVAARFWTERLSGVLALSALMGAAIGSVGTALSSRFSLTPAGPVIVLVGAAVFFISMLAAPRRGILALRLSQSAFARRFAEQGVLGRVLAAEAEAGPIVDIDDRSTAAATRRLIAAQAVVRDAQGQLRLTVSGRRRAEQIVRGRRLWQQLFLNSPELAPLYADLDTESIDALLPPDLIQQLEAESSTAADDRSEAQ